MSSTDERFEDRSFILDGVTYHYEHYHGIVVLMEGHIDSVRFRLTVSPTNERKWKDQKRSSKRSGKLWIRVGSHQEVSSFPEQSLYGYPEKIALEIRRTIESWKLKNRILLVHSL